ncbi:spiro-SPASM protein [Treponema sp. OMZ 840]|uniref:spiro-SPASM protein n=1 Tax=Treponema sp. OMZ 840 TaxID=244313 RepID=UPI003D9314FA
MKAFVFLYAAEMTDFAFRTDFKGVSARDKTALWAKHIDTSIGTQSIDDKMTVAQLLSRMETVLHEKKADFAVYAWADCPFLNDALTSELIALHTRYKAEYSFADGYPYGLTPEIIDAGTVRILSELARSKPDLGNAPVKRDSLFSLLKTDINSFEIETLIAPEDYRYLRLSLNCFSLRDSLCCRRLHELCPDTANADMLCKTAQNSEQVQRTLPSFYNVQIYSSGKAENIYEVQTAAAAMDFKKFKSFLADASEFSPDAVIGLSFLGDPVYHPDFVLFAEAVLARPEFSLLIETDAQNLDIKTIERIRAAAADNAVRNTGYKAVNWIIKLDAADETVYKRIHTAGSLETAENAVRTLKPLFPNAVYPQMVRIHCNENQLEAFFRKWKADGELIIQKYDHISGFLEDMRPADLSPALRTPCWHIKRDMCILADGRVPRCKAAVFNTEDFYGNIFTDGLESVWNKGYPRLREQLQGIYTGDCKKSDEYYTFNF